MRTAPQSASSQTIGALVEPSPTTGNSSAVWDQLADGHWLSDLYVDDTARAGQFSISNRNC